MNYLDISRDKNTNKVKILAILDMMKVTINGDRATSLRMTRHLDGFYQVSHQATIHYMTDQCCFAID